MQVRFTVPAVVVRLFHCQYVENFNLQIPHYHICQESLKIQSRSLRLYFRNGRSSPYNFPFSSLLSKTKIDMHKEIANKGRKQVR